MKCPSCGAETTGKFCEFCGSEMPKEKGGNTTINITNNYYSEEKPRQSATRQPQRKQQPKKKRKTWLWVLGWIFIFPLPLTILLLRPTNKLNKKVKYGIIAVAWIVYAIWIIGSSSNNDNNTASNDTSETVSETPATTEEETTTKDAETEADTQEETASVPVFFEHDDVVNQFIIDYQAVAGYEMTGIEKGNIRQKCFCYAGNCYMEILDSLDAAAENVNLSINFGDCSQDEIMDVTKNCLKVFGATDEEIQKTIDDFTVNNDGDYMIEGYATNSSIICTYVPTKELSKGKSIGRIDIASSTYGK